MKRPILTVVLLLAFLVTPANGQVVVTFVGPSTYADPEWQTVCMANKGIVPSYIGTIEVCPSGAPAGIVSRCTTTVVSYASLPGPAQTVVNSMISSWKTEHPEF